MQRFCPFYFFMKPWNGYLKVFHTRDQIAANNCPKCQTLLTNVTPTLSLFKLLWSFYIKLNKLQSGKHKLDWEYGGFKLWKLIINFNIKNECLYSIKLLDDIYFLSKLIETSALVCKCMVQILTFSFIRWYLALWFIVVPMWITDGFRKYLYPPLQMSDFDESKFIIYSQLCALQWSYAIVWFLSSCTFDRSSDIKSRIK